MWRAASRVAKVIGRLGIIGGLRYLFLERSDGFLGRVRGRDASSDPYWLRARSIEAPLWCRRKSSDRQVFSQVFIEREYACLDSVFSPKLVIDCGANVGFTSAYFLSRFPEAHVLAVEPDPGNFAMLEKNLRPYGARATTLQTAVWSHAVGLKLSRDPEDDRDWAVQVRALRDDEVPDLVAMDIGSLLELTPFELNDILKVDVEHAEVEIFGRGLGSWLDRVQNIAIELHGEDARTVFFKAIDPATFTFGRCGELTIAKRILDERAGLALG